MLRKLGSHQPVVSQMANNYFPSSVSFIEFLMSSCLITMSSISLRPSSSWNDVKSGSKSPLCLPRKGSVFSPGGEPLHMLYNTRAEYP